MTEQTLSKLYLQTICDYCAKKDLYLIQNEAEANPPEECYLCHKKNTVIFQGNILSEEETPIMDERDSILRPNAGYSVNAKGIRYFDPVKLVNIILNSNRLITLDTNITYKFSHKTGMYSPCDIELAEMVRKTLDEGSRVKRIDEVIQQVKIATRMERPLLDPRNIPFANGIFNIDKMELRNYTADDYYFEHMAAEYRPEWYECPSIDKFYAEVTEHDKEREWLLEFAASTLIPEIFEPKMQLDVGEGRNGKSMNADINRSILGDSLCTGISLHDMKEFGVEPLYSKRPLLNISGELSRVRDLDTDVLKKAIAGDFVTVNRKHRSQITFLPTTKFMALTNELPENLKDLSDGFCRRILPIYFERQFPVDEDFRKKVTSHKEVSAFATTVLIPLLREILDRKPINYLNTPTEEEVRAFFLDNANSINSFCQERLEYIEYVSQGSGDEMKAVRTPAEDIQHAYRAFCETNKLKKSSNNALGKGISRFFKVKAKLNWNQPSPVQMTTMRAPNGQDSFTQAYSNIRLKQA